jgi:hypothetical protein
MAVLASRLLAPPSLAHSQRELASDARSLALSLRVHCNAFEEAFPHRRKGFGVSLGVERKHQAIIVVVVVGALEGTKSSEKTG